MPPPTTLSITNSENLLLIKEIKLQSSTVIKSLCEYKKWANEELFRLILTIDPEIFSEVIHSVTRVLNHAFVVDEIFKSHLLKTVHNHVATNTQETPTLQMLFSKVRELDFWYCSYVADLVEDLLHESISFTFTDGESGLMSREEMHIHVITHGGYHRGQAGQIIRAASVNPPRDIYTRFLHLSEPFRRERKA